MTRRSYGSGSIRQKKGKDGKPIKNKWEVCFSWSDPIEGRKRQFSVVNGSKAEAKRRLEEMKAAHDSGIKPQGGETPFAVFAKEWQERREAANEVGSNDLKATNYAINLAISHIGNMRLKDINAETVEKLRATIREEKRKPDGTTISAQTMTRYEATLKQVFKTAVNYDYILRNPYDRARRIQQKPSERRALSEKDAMRLARTLDKAEKAAIAEYTQKEARQAARGNDSRRESIKGLKDISCIFAVRLGLATGARKGEILGLTWGAIGKDGRVQIDKSLERVAYGEKKGELRLKDPKSEAGKRVIWIDPDTLSHLKAWRAIQARELQKIGVLNEGKPRKDTPVICSNAGGFLDPNNFSHWWEKWRKENGFPGLLFHELRHTQATRLIASGADVKTVQKRLGHSSPILTMGIYTHTEEEAARRIALQMGAILNGGNVTEKPEKESSLQKIC